MELALLLLTIFWLMRLTVSANPSSIRCYKCEPTVVTPDGRYQDCDYVNGSNTAYIRQCPRSTMCSKRVTTLDVETGIKITSVIRGCAPQTQDDVPAKNGSKWYYPNITYEPYEEKCEKIDPSNGDKVTSTYVCYCRGDLCNGNNEYDTTLHSNNTTLNGNNTSNVPDASAMILSKAFTTVLLAIGIILISYFNLSMTYHITL